MNMRSSYRYEKACPNQVCLCPSGSIAVPRLHVAAVTRLTAVTRLPGVRQEALRFQSCVWVLVLHVWVQPGATGVSRWLARILF